MAQYQVKILADNYSLVAWLGTYTRIKYTVALNRMTSAQVDLPANDAKIPDCDLMSRLLIVRNGAVVWGGLLQTESWEVEATSSGTKESPYALDAMDHCLYLLWRTIPRPQGEDFDTRTGAADDLAKEYVKYHAGASAAAPRQYSDLTVQADATDCAVVTKSWVGEDLLSDLQNLATEQQFYWRMVPSTTGVEFQTAYPLWGLDRTKGNGVNDELVYTFDRRNVRKMSYKRDLADHYNHAYMAGTGEGQYQLVEEVEDAAAVAAWKRREVWATASNYSTIPELDDEGERVIQDRKPLETMAITPARGGGISIDNLGDKVTVFERRYGRTFEYSAIVTAIDVEVDRDGVEQMTPAELVAAT